jgi:mercuric ion transport protein
VKAQTATAFGSVISGVLASACCIGPLAFGMLGISGAALARSFEPFRPFLLILTYGLLGAAFYVAYRPARAACGPGEACEMPRVNRAGVVLLWIAAVVVVLTTAFPWYSVYLF